MKNEKEIKEQIKEFEKVRDSYRPEEIENKYFWNGKIESLKWVLENEE